MTELYNSRLNSGRSLASAITATSPSLTLNAALTGVESGTYRLRFDSEVLTGDYSGAGAVFTNLKHGLEGTTPSTHRKGVLMHHVITGDSLTALRNDTVRQTQRAVNLTQYARSPGVRAFLGANFT